MGHICVICAVQHEITPILKRFRATGISGSADLPVWRFQAFGNNVTLMRSGIGRYKACQAATAAAALAPGIIISAGFCGALSPEIAVGEVFLADHLLRYSSGSIDGRITPDIKLTDLVVTGLRSGTFITTDEIVEKSRINRLLPDPAAINLLDMESQAIAEICQSNSISFTAIRSVSDTADHDPSSLLRKICDNEFNISMPRVMLSIIGKPSILSEFLQLSRNAATAGSSLSVALAAVLEQI